MKEKLDEILKFLEENKKYNQQLQKEYALGTSGLKNENFDRVIALLYDTANTQSQPKIDKLAEFFKSAYKYKNSFNSFSGFLEYLTIGKVNNDKPYETLFKALRQKEGWGDKTSALFVKNILNYHHNNEYKELKIWNDVPNLSKSDNLYLPVDAVILAIFNKLDPSHKPKWNFKTINKEIQNYFSNEEMILFDDLWFWGFITQRTTKDSKNREFIWNENKYWMIKEADKDSNEIQNIKRLARDFLKLLGVSDE